MGRVWSVRSRTVGGNWGGWHDRGLIYLGDHPYWQSVSEPVGDLLLEDGIPDIVQFQLGVWDVSDIFNPWGVQDATPAPVREP